MEIVTAQTGIYYSTERVDEIPAIIKKGVIYIAYASEDYGLAVFSCPCGCGETIELNLNKAQRPYWCVQYHHPRIVSIYPSVEKITGCKSSFKVWMGKVSWNTDYDL
jgi:hypothetical protein